MLSYKNVFQLAQDKGYRLKKGRTISNDGVINVTDYLWGDEFEVKNHIRKSEILEDSFIELSLIAKWLRESHNIDIEIQNQFSNALEGRLYFATYYPIKYDFPHFKVTSNFPTYEGALLSGINESLNLIK